MTSHRVSRIFSYLKKATHVFVIASYLFHGCAPAFATRVKFDEVEGRQKKVSSIDALRSIVLKERQREATIRQEKKHEEAYDGRHPHFTPRATFDENEYTLKIKALPQAHDNAGYQVELMLSKKNGGAVQTLDHRTFTSKTFYGAQGDGSPFSSLMHRSLGFAYSLKGIGTINVCWEGTLLLNNLNFRGAALNIETTGNILARNLKGTKMSLQGNEICFEGKNTIQFLSLGFGEGLRPDGPGSRTASIMPKAALVTNDLILKNGILQNFGRLTLQGTAKVRILDNQKTGTVFLKKGSLITRQLQNQGTMNLDGFVTVLNDGSLQFGEPAFLFGTWQAPHRIKGLLGQGRHLSVVALDRLKKIPETELHVYGKSFSNTSDHVFSHPLHLMVETFKNTKTLRAPELSVMAATITNDGSITGNRLKIHASQNGQNKGRIEASQHLDVVLPQIDDWGILISDGDLRFKTTERDFTWNEGEWLGVGRNLYLTLVGGHLTLNGNHTLPGSAVFNAHNFTLQGELEAAGDLEVQTQEDIDILVKTRISKPKFTLADLPWPTPDYLDLSTEPDVYEYVLSRMKSGGALRLKGQNVNNAGGEVLGEHALTVEVLGNLVNGTRIETKRTESRIGHLKGGRFYYRIPEFKGIGAYLRTMGPMSLTAGDSLHNNHADIWADGTLSMKALSTITNSAGNIRSGGPAHLEGGDFKNEIEPVVEVVTGRDNCGEHEHQWYVNDRYMYTGQYNHPLQEFAGSKPATLQTMGDLTLDFSRHILNQASNILAGGVIQINNAQVEFLSTTLSASISRQEKGWHKKETAGILQAVVSSDTGISMRNIQSLVDAGMMSAPYINVNRSPYVTFEDPETARARALVPHKQIKTNFSLRPQLQDLQSLSFSGESEQPFNPGTQVIIGSIEGTLPPILGNTTQILFALQQAFAEHYHKGYILPHLKPLEQLIQLQRNARKFALKQIGRKIILPWETLVVSAIDADEIEWPMIFYRPTFVGDQEYLVPEYWGPKDLIHRFLMTPCGAGVADEHIKAQKVGDLHLNGNLYARQSIQTRSKRCFLGPQVWRQDTRHGQMDITGGGNQETDKGGTVSNHAKKHLGAKGGSIKAPDGIITLTSDGTMELDTAVTRRKHDDGETQIEEARHHPFQMDAGDISIKALEDLILRATQAHATRTIWAEGANVLITSVMDEYHEEKKHKQRGFLSSTTTKETTHRETHQVVNFKAGTSLDVHATKGNMDGDAPQMTAPRIRLGFPHGALLLRTVANKFFFNLETLDKNAFLNAFSVEGFSSIQHMDAQMNTDELILSEGPAHVELTQEQIERQSALAKFLQNRKNTTISIAHNEHQSWHEEQITVGPGLAALIAIGVSLVMPGIGTGPIGTALTQTASQVSSSAAISLINNQGNLLRTFDDLTSGDSLRGMFVPSVESMVSRGLGLALGVPLHPTGTDIIAHAQHALLNATSRIAVRGALGREDFSDVLEGAFRECAATFVSSYGSAHIGDWHHRDVINTLEQNLAHAAVGALSGELLSGDPLGGAIGAVIGENVGKKLREEMNEAGITDKHPDYEEAVDYAVNIARFTAVAASSVLNKDPDAASLAASNAARHNTFHHAPTYNLEDQIQREKEEKAGAGLLLDLWGTPIEPLSEIQKSERAKIDAEIEEIEKDCSRTDLNFWERYELIQRNNFARERLVANANIPTTVGDVALEVVPLVPGFLRTGAAVLRTGAAAFRTGATVTNLNFVRSLENVTAASRQLGYTEKASCDLARTGNVSFAEAATSLKKRSAPSELKKQTPNPKVAKNNANTSPNPQGETAVTPSQTEPNKEWKDKIVGSGQKTKTPGHSFRSNREAIKLAKRDDVEVVLVDRGVNRLLPDGNKVAPNRRPDVTYQTTDGKIHQIEVPSNSDKPGKLDLRMEDTQKKLPEHMRGEYEVIHITKDKK